MFATDQADPLGILSSTKQVVEQARHLALDPGALEQLAAQVERTLRAGLPGGEEAFGAFASLAEKAQFALVVDAVNFCFWAEKGQEKWQVEWPPGQLTDGGFALNAVFQRAIASNVPVLDAGYLAGLTLAQTRALFHSSGTAVIPLLEKRHKHLVEVGQVLQRSYQGQFLNLLEAAGFDAIQAIRRMVNDFSSFNDTAAYDGQEVVFLKRAQICVHDLSLFPSSRLKNLDQLTAFADYKLPQILRGCGALRYAPALAEKVDRYILIPAGSEEELEIRAATIWGVELLRQKLKRHTAASIDNAIWYISQEQAGLKPYHRTYTVFY